MSSDPQEMTTRQLWRGLLLVRRACQEQPELFFGPDEESEAARVLREQSAAVLCADCPVQGLCLEYAVRNREEHGVWAGFTGAEIAAFADGAAAGEVA